MAVSLVDGAGGSMISDCGGTLSVTGTVTNNGVMEAVNGGTLESYGLVVNNGLIKCAFQQTRISTLDSLTTGFCLSSDRHPPDRVDKCPWAKMFAYSAF